MQHPGAFLLTQKKFKKFKKKKTKTPPTTTPKQKQRGSWMPFI